MFRMNKHFWMISLISKEWRDISATTKSIVVRKLHKQQEFRPVVLLIVIIYTKVLLEYLVHVFSLSTIFGVVV